MASINDFTKILWKSLEHMMRPLKYLIFLIFNLAYQDGNNEKNDPDFYSIMFMIFFEFFLLIVGLALLNKFVDFDVFSDVKPSRGAKLILGFIFFAQLYLPNHYFFIKKNTLIAFTMSLKMQR